jgi:outer membrane lipoprotein LolB
MRFCNLRVHALAAALLLAGCASLSPPVKMPAEAPPVQAAAARTYREAIELSGRLSVHYQNNGKDEAVHGSFVWEQRPERTSVTLLSPLGQTLAVIDVTPAGAVLQQAGQPARAAADVDALAADTFGWPLPVSGLREWLQGFATDALGSRFVASPRSTAVATRDGWRIRYAGWQDEQQEQSRPKRIDLERYTARTGDVSIRIVIDKWQ